VGAGVLTAAPRAARAHDAPERAGAAALPGSPSPSLAVIGPAPPFTLVDPTGRSVSLADYTGRVVLLSFVYTTCRSACPLVTQRMAVLQRRLREAGLFGSRVGFVSITVDPDRDGAATLARYAKAFGADPRGWTLAALVGLAAQTSQAQETAEPPSAPTVLPPVVVTAPPPVAASSEVLIPGRDFELRPQGRPADMVRLIPGFVISQHQGGGKAEQYFLRGFDADHGTVKLVDGLKGPYFVEFGDFATAGAVNFVTKDLVDANTVEVAGGMFNTQRYLTLLSPTRDALKSLVAIDAYRSDGPFEHGNGYERFNIFAKAS